MLYSCSADNLATLLKRPDAPYELDDDFVVLFFDDEVDNQSAVISKSESFKLGPLSPATCTLYPNKLTDLVEFYDPPNDNSTGLDSGYVASVISKMRAKNDGTFRNEGLRNQPQKMCKLGAGTKLGSRNQYYRVKNYSVAQL